MPTLVERIAELDRCIQEDRVGRGAWRQQIDGRAYACLLTTLFPEVDKVEDICLVDTLPSWFALLIPSLNDEVPAEFQKSMLPDFANNLRKAVTFSEVDWRNVQCQLFVAIIDEWLHTQYSSDTAETAIVRAKLLSQPPQDNAWSWETLAKRMLPDGYIVNPLLAADVNIEIQRGTVRQCLATICCAQRDYQHHNNGLTEFEDDVISETLNLAIRTDRSQEWAPSWATLVCHVFRIITAIHTAKFM